MKNISKTDLITAFYLLLASFARAEYRPASASGDSIPPSNASAWTAQNDSHFTPEEIAKVLGSGAGLSGPGQPVTGNGRGGWRSGMEGVLYAGDHPASQWRSMPASMISGSVIGKGLLPSIRPLWDVHIRDAVICVGGDGNYYMTGSTGDNIWAYNDGVELWRSADLKNWQYLGLVWSIEKDGGWERQWRNLHDKPARAVWAPELHYIKGNYFICLSMAPYGISILRSVSGRPEGPYVHATDPGRPFVKGIDATLFQDDDGKVYFTYSGAGKIVRMKDDLSDSAGSFFQVTLADPDHDSTHHAAKCVKRGMNDLGHEGAVLFKANGKYYLGAADDYEGRYSTCIAMSDNIGGPYRMRHETVPCGGGGGFFQDKEGQWYGTFFGNDSQSPWREKPGIVKVEFDHAGKIHVAKQQIFSYNGPPDSSAIPGPWKFDFGPGKAAGGYTKILPATLYTPETGYGFDFGSAVTGTERGGTDAIHDGYCTSERPFYFSVKVPEGNYTVTLVLGDPKGTSVTTVKAECRRLMIEKATTTAGRFATVSFTIHVRDSIITYADGTTRPVRLKPREYAYLHWDNKLTLEFSNTSPKICAMEIRPAHDPVQVFLAGNSTVVDQAEEPWAAWGQMIPAFFQPEGIVIANYAESGETLKAFVGERRLDKLWTMAHPGDYLFIEFAHNDQKPGGNYLEPFTTYKEKLGWYIAEARKRGMIPVLVTSMHRRNFDSTGHIVNTLGDYPEAMRQTAKELNSPLIDLNAMSKILYEAWGPEQSVHAFVHYPAHSFPGQEKELKDDTHFNDYGAYELARCVLNGIRQGVPGLAKYLKDDLSPFDPAHPDPLESWSLPVSGHVTVTKPDGN